MFLIQPTFMVFLSYTTYPFYTTFLLLNSTKPVKWQEQLMGNKNVFLLQLLVVTDDFLLLLLSLLS